MTTKKNIKAEKIRGRIINFRAFLVISLFLFCAVFAALIACNLPVLGYTIFGLLLIAAGVFCFVYRKNKFKFITFLLCIMLSALSFTLFLTTNAAFIHKTDYSKPISVVGTVEQDIMVDGTRRVYLNGISLNGSAAKGKILLYVKNSADGGAQAFKEGSVLALTTALSHKKLVDGYKVNGAAFRSNVRYSASIDAENLQTIGQKSPGLFVKIHSFFREKLAGGLGERYGALALGMIFGDKAYLDTQTEGYFSAAGIYHLLTVSGLQVGFVAAMLAFILRKLKIRRLPTAITSLIVLFLYAFLSGFTPSVLRAAFMSAVGLAVYLTGERRDPLSALCFAFSAIVSVAPFYLFEAGFILSFGCVLGIVLFYPPIYRFLLKLLSKNSGQKADLISEKDAQAIEWEIDRRPQKNEKLWIRLQRAISSTIAVCVSVQIGGFPAAIYFFSRFQPYAIIVNILLTPITMLVFMTILLTLLLCCIIPPLQFLLKINLVGLKLIEFVAESVSRLPFATVVLYALPIIFCIYPLYFLCSRFVMIKKKRLYRLAAIVICAALIFAQNPIIAKDASVVPVDTGGTVTYINANGKGYLVGDIWSAHLVTAQLKELKIRQLDAIFLDKMDYNTAIQMQNLKLMFASFTVYYPVTPAEPLSPDTAKALRNIKTAAFQAAADGERVELDGGFHAIFMSLRLRAYGFHDKGSNILMPDNGYNYRRLDTSDYNIIRAAQYLDAGDKLYLLGKTDEEISGANIIFWKNKPYIFNYKTYGFKRLERTND